MNLNRRKFLFGASAVVAAPAIAKIQNLMPVKVMEDYTLAGYKGVTGYDAGLFYCPYIPLQVMRADDATGIEFTPHIGFKTRYGITTRPFDGHGLNNTLSELRLPEPTIRPGGVLSRLASRIIGPQRNWLSSESNRSTLQDLRY